MRVGARVKASGAEGEGEVQPLEKNKRRCTFFSFIIQKFKTERRKVRPIPPKRAAGLALLVLKMGERDGICPTFSACH